MILSKTCKTLKQAERYHNSLYNKYNTVQALRWPSFSEEGTYTWEVANKIVPEDNVGDDDTDEY